MTEEKIIQFLRIHGPSVPTQVAKFLNISILFASAHLSELASRKKVKVSHLKVGGSPLYYLPDQEGQLAGFAQNNINPKDWIVLERLRAQGLLRETEADLLTKVALRSLKDFAIPLQVSHQGKGEVFWRWHLLTPEKVNEHLSRWLNPVEIPSTPPLVSDALPAPEIKESPVEVQKVVSLQGVPPQPEVEGKTHQIPKKRQPVPDQFLPALEEFFKKIKVVVEQKEILRKNAELNFILQVPSAVGMMKYFCKAKQKQRCDEKDLSAAYMEAQMKKLPLLFLYSGELHKKAEEMLNSGALENGVARKVE